MGPIQALELALGKEVEAAQMYERFAGEFPVAKDTFIFLAGEEQKHKKLIEELISKLENS